MASPRGTTRRGVWWALCLGAVLLTLASVRPASRLTISTRLEDLLPRHLEAADDYLRVQEVFGSLERIFVVVRGPGGGGVDDPDTLIAGAEIVAEGLRDLPGIAWVRSGLTEEDEAFLLDRVLPRAPLLVDLDDARLDALLAPDGVRRRVRIMRDVIASPTGPFESALYAADPLGFMDGTLPDDDRFPIDPTSGAFLSEAGTEALVVAATTQGGLDSALGRAIQSRIDTAARAAADELGVALQFLAVGGPLYAAHDEAVIRRDVVRSVGTSAVGVVALLLGCFGGFLVPLALFVAVAAGVLWTAGLIRAIRGEISGIGLSFASVLIGLGVDYGIHGATRFVQGRAGGGPVGGAMRRALRDVAPAILVSIATTAGAFLVLSRARFGPVAELGWTVAIGIVAVGVSSATLGASALVLFSRRRGRDAGEAVAAVRGGILWEPLGRGAAALVGVGRRRPGIVLLAVVLLTALSLAGLGRLSFDADLRLLRPDEGAIVEAETVLAASFATGLDATRVVVRGADAGQALDAAERMRQAAGRHVGAGVAVSSPSDWIPGEAQARARVERLSGERLRRAVATLREELDSAGFDPAAFRPALEILDAVTRGEVPAAIPFGDLPDWLDEALHVAPDGVYAAVQLDAPTGQWPDGPPDAVLAALREADPHAAIASVPRLGAQLRSLVGDELRRLGGWSTVAVLLLVLVSFRGRPWPALLALTPVALGGVWTVGLWGLAGFPLTLISVALAPVILGIGIDDGLHALHGARVEGSVAAAVARSGRAMTLTTLTTCAGFGGLAFSSIPALRDAALLVSTGTLACLLITLMVLPAIEGLVRPVSPAAPATPRNPEPPA